MASKMELKKASNALKSAGVAERECIDWDKTGIEYIWGIDTSTYGKKTVKKETK